MKEKYCKHEYLEPIAVVSNRDHIYMKEKENIGYLYRCKNCKVVLALDWDDEDIERQEKEEINKEKEFLNKIKYELEKNGKK